MTQEQFTETTMINAAQKHKIIESHILNMIEIIDIIFSSTT